MSFLAPDPQPIPQEDPAVTKMRMDEQKQAEADKLRATQSQLTVETSQRSNRYGTRSLLGQLGPESLRSLLGSG